MDFDRYLDSAKTQHGKSLDCFRLCARCGSAEDFAAALAAHDAGQAIYQAAYQQQRKDEEAKRMQASKERRERYERMQVSFGFQLESDPRYGLVFKYEGVRFTMQECND